MTIWPSSSADHAPAIRLFFARTGRGLLCAFLSASISLPGRAVEGTNSSSLADLSIEQLMNESVTTVSRRETPLEQSPAAVSVITQDDIRRLGITSIPEALRLVPGLDVARINASQWAIGSRGFNNQFANKLLVLIDGRTVYNPSFSGVFWGVQDTAMEDIDRVEVIRGPGASLWGANAVNGVINIVTKSARETQGTMVSTAFGTEDQPSTTAQYGGQAGTNLFYRVYVKYFDRMSLTDSTGHSAQDAWNATRGGFRLDWEPSHENTFTLQGDYYYTETTGVHDVPELTAPFSRTLQIHDFDNGGNILGRWNHRFSSTSVLTVQSYFDHSIHMFDGLKDRTETFDLDIQHRFAIGTWNDVIWGLGYRHTVSSVPPTPIATLTPATRALNLYTAFVQDQVSLVPHTLSLILGSKLEHNDFTGFELQPSARLLWTPSKKQTAWLAVSRAVRTPSRADTDFEFRATTFQPSPSSPTVEVVNIGNQAIESETVLAYELGYRVEPTKQLSIDLTTFYNAYKDVVGTIPGTSSFEAGHIETPLSNANNQHGETYGAEVSLQWKVTDHWRLGADYSWLRMHIHPDATVEGSSPQNQAHLRSYIDLPFNLELNSSLSYVDRLVTAAPIQRIPAYLRLDIGLVWHVTKSLEVGVWGQNLLENHHPEFSELFSRSATEIPRSVMGKITFSY